MLKKKRKFELILYPYRGNKTLIKQFNLQCFILYYIIYQFIKSAFQNNSFDFFFLFIDYDGWVQYHIQLSYFKGNPFRTSLYTFSFFHYYFPNWSWEPTLAIYVFKYVVLSILYHMFFPIHPLLIFTVSRVHYYLFSSPELNEKYIWKEMYQDLEAVRRLIFLAAWRQFKNKFSRFWIFIVE